MTLQEIVNKLHELFELNDHEFYARKGEYNELITELYDLMELYQLYEILI